MISLIGICGGILSQFVREYGDIEGGAELDEIQSSGLLSFPYLDAYIHTYISTSVLL